MRCCRQYVLLLKAILITILVVNSFLGILGAEDKDGNLSENKYGRKQRRIMRTSSNSESALEDIVS